MLKPGRGVTFSGTIAATTVQVGHCCDQCASLWTPQGSQKLILDSKQILKIQVFFCIDMWVRTCFESQFSRKLRRIAANPLPGCFPGYILSLNSFIWRAHIYWLENLVSVYVRPQIHIWNTSRKQTCATFGVVPFISERLFFFGQEYGGEYWTAGFTLNDMHDTKKANFLPDGVYPSISSKNAVAACFIDSCLALPVPGNMQTICSRVSAHCTAFNWKQ